MRKPLLPHPASVYFRFGPLLLAKNEKKIAILTSLLPKSIRGHVPKAIHSPSAISYFLPKVAACATLESFSFYKKKTKITELLAHGSKQWDMHWFKAKHVYTQY